MQELVKKIIMHSHWIIYPLLILFIYLIIKSETYKSLKNNIKKDYVFFIIVILIGSFIVLSYSPFQPLVYYDEHNYVIHGQNIIEENKNALCFERENDVCTYFQTAPHGILINTIYSLFYSYDFEQMYSNVVIFNFIIYLFNAILIYCLAKEIYGKKSISRLASLIILLLPYNIKFASTAMPATICNFVLLIALFSIHNTLSKEKNEIYLILSSLFILTLSRVEYVIPLTILIPVFLSIPRKNNSNFLIKFIVFTSMILSYLFAIFYKKNKMETSIGLADLNKSYLQFYISSPIFFLMTILVLVYVIPIIIQNTKELFKKKNIFKIISTENIMIIIFTVLVGIYSTYRFESVYRYLIPINSIFILFFSKSLNQIIRKISTKKIIKSTITILILIIISYSLYPEIVSDKQNFSESGEGAEDFLQIMKSEVLSNKTIFMKAPYLGQITRKESFLENYERANILLKNNKTIYYVNSYFEQFEESPLHKLELKSEKIYDDKSEYDYDIYSISLAK
jgi:hypothetical protein